MELKLWEKEIPYQLEDVETPNLFRTFFLKTEKPLPCVVVFPGGAYACRAPYEGDPIAEFFNTRGIHAVVVEYRVMPNRYPAAIADAQRAIRILRANAKEWGIDPNRIVTCGFSAGGHLAASALVLADALPQGWCRDEIDAYPFLPNGGILCYPVISIEETFGHAGSGKNLLGERYEEMKDYLSLENRVTEHTPKAFLWHTSDDPVVNVKNSLEFAARLRDCGVQFEMHVYPHGEHGLALAKDREDVRGWADLAANWILKNI
jgi:acetyl esterase/lipase